MTLAWHAESFKGGDGGRSEYTDIHTHTQQQHTHSHTYTSIHTHHTHTPHGKAGAVVLSPPTAAPFFLRTARERQPFLWPETVPLSAARYSDASGGDGSAMPWVYWGSVDTRNKFTGRSVEVLDARPSHHTHPKRWRAGGSRGGVISLVLFITLVAGRG